MTRTGICRLLLVVAVVCFIITVLTTEHTITVAASGLSLGYVLGMMYPYTKEEA